MRPLMLILVSITAINEVQLHLLTPLKHVEWYKFKIQHNKEYETEMEEHKRMQIFINNKRMIEEHNKQFESGLVSYELGMNEYGDMTMREFHAAMNQVNMSNVELTPPSDAIDEDLFLVVSEGERPPTLVDWRRAKAVTSIKNQGACGSCWAFATTGALESHQYIRENAPKKPPISLSEQNLIDCTKRYGNNGCNGGNYFLAFNYIRDNKGIDTEQSYPYEGLDFTKCRYKPRDAAATDKGYRWIPQGDEYKMLLATWKIGPLAICVDASGKFMFYKSGVYYNPSCTKNINHAMLIVGYGKDYYKGDYWLVKNSWGISWGERGYVRMARNRNNHCGIALYAAFPML